MQSAIKEVFGSMFEAMLNSEMESYLSYEPNSCEGKETTNRRNSYFDKTIKNKVLAMYARDMSQLDISATIDDIYGFKLSADQIFKITNYVLDEQENWQNRTFVPFIVSTGEHDGT